MEQRVAVADCSAAVCPLDTDLLKKNLLNTIMSPSAYALVSVSESANYIFSSDPQVAPEAGHQFGYILMHLFSCHVVIL